MTTYGYIGLGVMGSAMTEHLLSTGARTVVFDLDGAAVQAAVDRGAAGAGSAAEVAAASDVVSICVPAAEHIDAVMSGDDGIEGGARDGLTVLIHSTVHPDTVTGARLAAEPWGVEVFDACVTGGAELAVVGELAMFVGGWDEMGDEARALVETYGSKVIQGGPVGSGAALKIGVNVMTYMQQAAARIAFALIESWGADPNGLVEAWRHTRQLGAITERYLTLLSFSDDDITGDLRTFLEGTCSIAEKDLELARLLGSTTPELDAVLDAMVAAMPAVSRLA